MADDTFMNTVCTLHDATSLINSSPTTTDPTNSGTTPGSTDGTALEHRQVKPELVPLLAQVLVLVVPVQVVLILAAPVHPVTVTGNTHR